MENFPIQEGKVYNFFNIFVISMLILNMSMVGVFFITKPLASADEGDLCPVKTDVILIIDKSESMGQDGNDSLCEWYKRIDYGTYYGCLFQNDFGLSESECLAKESESEGCAAPVYTPATPNKMESAKEANKNFVDKLGINDQSGLISFVGIANLDKSLDSAHSNTKDAIDVLSIGEEATNIANAIETAISDFDANGGDHSVKVTILLTDGQDSDSSIAQAQAVIAKTKGYKIFTIGLGDQVDTTALTLIAQTTDAKYYPASDQDELNNIYKTIAEEICQYSSISGCKYSDSNKDEDIIGEDTIDDWEIILNGDTENPKLTDEFGCYEFLGLLPGTYTVSEGGKGETVFKQTYPIENNGEYTFTLIEGEATTTIDFGNYLPTCPNGIKDTGYDGYIDEECDTDQPIECETEDGYQGFKDCIGCVLENCEPTEYCGDEEVNGTEICEIGNTRPCEAENNYAGEETCLENCSGWGECEPIENCGDGIQNGNEECDYNDGQGPACDENCLLIVDEPECADSDEDGVCDENDNCPEIANPNQEDLDEDGIGDVCDDPDCGNGFIEDGEECDDGNTEDNDGCSAVCQTEEDDEEDNQNTSVNNNTGGGGGVITALYIHSESVLETGVDNTLITWHTNKPATSRVVYDVSPVNPLGPWPNLGYANSTIEDPEKTTFHEVTISGLLSNTLYYFRTISSASPEIFGKEFNFTTAQAEETEEQDSEQEENSAEENQDDSTDNEEEINEEENLPVGGADDEEENADTGSEQNESSNYETQGDEGQVLGESVMSQALVDNQNNEDEQKDKQEDNQNENLNQNSAQEQSEKDSTTDDNKDEARSGWFWFIIIMLIIAGGYAGYKAYYSKNKEQ